MDLLTTYLTVCEKCEYCETNFLFWKILTCTWTHCMLTFILFIYILFSDANPFYYAIHKCLVKFAIPQLFINRLCFILAYFSKISKQMDLHLLTLCLLCNLSIFLVFNMYFLCISYNHY